MQESYTGDRQTWRPESGSRLKQLLFSAVREPATGDNGFVFKSQVCVDTHKSAPDLGVLNGVVSLIVALTKNLSSGVPSV